METWCKRIDSQLLVPPFWNRNYRRPVATLKFNLARCSLHFCFSLTNATLFPLKLNHEELDEWLVPDYFAYSIKSVQPKDTFINQQVRYISISILSIVSFIENCRTMALNRTYRLRQFIPAIQLSKNYSSKFASLVLLSKNFYFAELSSGFILRSYTSKLNAAKNIRPSPIGKQSKIWFFSVLYSVSRIGIISSGFKYITTLV